MMQFIQHAFLNLKRNKRNDFFIGLLFFCLLLGFFCLLQVYAAVEHSLAETKKQTDRIINVEPDLKNQQHVTNLNEADLQALNDLPNVEESMVIGYAAVEIAGITLEDGQSIATFNSGLISAMGTPRIEVTSLDNASLETCFQLSNKMNLQGTLPLEQGSCLVTEDFAKSNKLKLGDELSIGNGEKKLQIVGIASPPKNHQELYGTVFINLATNEFLGTSADSTFYSATVRLSSRQAAGNFKQELRKLSAFDAYQIYTGSSFLESFDQFINQKELLLNGAIALSILSLLLIGLFYSQLFKRRGADIYALRLMGMRPIQLIVSTILEILLIALISTALADVCARFISEGLVANWLKGLRQASAFQVPILTIQHPKLQAAEIQRLLLTGNSVKFLVPYFASLLLILVGLTSRMIYVFGHYSFQLRRKR